MEAKPQRPTVAAPPGGVPTTFTREVFVHRRDAAENLVLGPDGQPIPERSLGLFTFRRPTVWDEMQIGVRKARNRGGQPLEALDLRTFVLAECFSVLPWQVEQAPDGWEWSKVYDMWELVAVYDAYRDGLKDLLGGGEGGGA